MYLSMIRDLYDNGIVAYKTAEKQTINLVLDTIRRRMNTEKKRVAAELQLHSDQGFQYTSQAYFHLTQSYGFAPSVSRCGNPFDNAMAENFFSILKTECQYRRKPASLKEVNSLMDSFIHFYNLNAFNLKQEWRRSRFATPFDFLSLLRRFWCSPNILGRFMSRRG